MIDIHLQFSSQSRRTLEMFYPVSFVRAEYDIGDVLVFPVSGSEDGVVIFLYKLSRLYR